MTVNLVYREKSNRDKKKNVIKGVEYRSLIGEGWKQVECRGVKKGTSKTETT